VTQSFHQADLFVGVDDRVAKIGLLFTGNPPENLELNQ